MASRHVIEIKTFSSQNYLNRFDLHIVETLKTNFIYSKKGNFTISINDKCSEEPLDLRSEQRRGAKQDDAIRWNDGTMERWNGGMGEYSTTRNALLYKMKVPQKWKYNETRK